MLGELLGFAEVASAPEDAVPECVGVWEVESAQGAGGEVDADDGDGAEPDGAADRDGLAGGDGEDGLCVGAGRVFGGFEGVYDGVGREGDVRGLGDQRPDGVEVVGVASLGASDGREDVGEGVGGAEPGVSGGGQGDDEVPAAVDPCADGACLLRGERGGLGAAGGGFCPGDDGGRGEPLPLVGEARDIGDLDVGRLVGEGDRWVGGTDGVGVLLEPGGVGPDDGGEGDARREDVDLVADARIGSPEESAGAVGGDGVGGGEGFVDEDGRRVVGGVEWEAGVDPERLLDAGVGGDDAVVRGAVAVGVADGHADDDFALLGRGVEEVDLESGPVSGPCGSSEAVLDEIDLYFVGDLGVGVCREKGEQRE